MADKKATSKAASLPWCRCHFHEWEGEAATLDFATAGFLHFLHRLMIERKSPVPMDIVLRMSRQRGSNARTVNRITESLIKRGLIHRTGNSLWCDFAAEEVAYREEQSQKIAKRNAKVSQKRWQKDQQNQRNSMPEKDRDKDGRPSSGGVQDQSVNNSLDNEGTAFADASRPHTGSDEYQEYTCEDHEEVERRNQAFIAGPLPPFDGQEVPPPSGPSEYLNNGFDGEVGKKIGSDAAAERHRQMVARCKQEADGLSPVERPLLDHFERKLKSGATLTQDEAAQLEAFDRYLSDEEGNADSAQVSDTDFTDDLLVARGDVHVADRRARTHV